MFQSFERATPSGCQAYTSRPETTRRSAGAATDSSFALRQPTLEQLEGLAQVRAQPLCRRGPGAARERLGAGVPEELPQDADEHVGRDLRIKLLRAELLADRSRDRIRVARHDLEL